MFCLFISTYYLSVVTIFTEIDMLSKFQIMCQVFSDNYERLLPEIYCHIDNCAFIAFDCEFTALRSDESQQNTLFDDVDIRYRRQAQASHHSIISQIGKYK